MHKKGDIRDDGKVFVGYVAKCANGERWVTRERFLEMHRPDWFEWRAAADERKLDRARRSEQHKKKLQHLRDTREERLAKKRAAMREYSREYQRKVREQNPEMARARAHEYYLRQKDSPEYKARIREAQVRFQMRQNPDYKSREQRAAERAEQKRIEDAERAEMKAQARRERDAREAMKRALKVGRVVLTPEQRKERRREEKRNYKHRRRALLRGMDSKATPKQIRAGEAKARGVCYYCGGKFKKLTVDHVVPLAGGGKHTMDNIVFACHGCNSEKRDLPPHEFVARFGRLLA